MCFLNCVQMNSFLFHKEDCFSSSLQIQKERSHHIKHILSLKFLNNISLAKFHYVVVIRFNSKICHGILMLFNMYIIIINFIPLLGYEYNYSNMAAIALYYTKFGSMVIPKFLIIIIVFLIQMHTFRIFLKINHRNIF